MKTPEEIKKGLYACGGADEWPVQHTDCPYDHSEMCTMYLCADALAYIEQLEAEREGKSDERNA